MQPQPAALDRELQAGAVLSWRAALLVQERFVDLLDVDMRPSCTGSTALAISMILRAAFSGLA
jgi:hypothetical protein